MHQERGGGGKKKKKIPGGGGNVSNLQENKRPIVQTGQRQTEPVGSLRLKVRGKKFIYLL